MTAHYGCMTHSKKDPNFFDNQILTANIHIYGEKPYFQITKNKFSADERSCLFTYC